MSVDKTIDNRNEKEARDKQDLDELLEKIMQELQKLDTEKEQISDDFKKLLEKIGILEFKILLKFTAKQSYEVVEQRMINIFIYFLRKLKRANKQVKPLKVIEYERYLDGIMHFKYSLPLIDITNEQCFYIDVETTLKDAFKDYEMSQDDCIALINKQFKEFTNTANEYLKEHKKNMKNLLC